MVQRCWSEEESMAMQKFTKKEWREMPEDKRLEVEKAEFRSLFKAARDFNENPTEGVFHIQNLQWERRWESLPMYSRIYRNFQTAFKGTPLMPEWDPPVPTP